MNRQENRLLPVVIKAAPRSDSPRVKPEQPAFDAAYVAQMYGQPGQKRGLRGGAPVLEAARAAYLEAEYSGEYDRRPPQGLIMKTAI